MAAGVVAETTAIVGKIAWWGGRDGHIVYEDEWAPDRSWFYHRRIYPVCSHAENEWYCLKCKPSFRVHLKLSIQGSSKGQLKPVSASLRAGLSHERYRGVEVDLGRISVDSIRKAKAWANQFATLSVCKVVFQMYYSSFEITNSKKGCLIEKFDDGWQEWLWSFDEHPDWMDLIQGVPSRKLRYRRHDDSGYSLIEGGSYGGVTISSWRSLWDRIRQRGEHWGQVGSDEFGPL